MERDLASRLILLDRKLAWVLVAVTLVLLASGYALARGLIQHPLVDDTHFNIKLVFVTLLVFHLYVVTFLIKFPLGIFLKGVRDGKANPTLWLKFIQLASGWALLLAIAVKILSGLSYYGWLSHLVPFFRHRQYDLLLNISLIIHVAAAVKSVIYRRAIINRKLDLLLYIATVALVVFAWYWEFFWVWF